MGQANQFSLLQSLYKVIMIVVMTEYERPNTVAGLVAKHNELSELRERYRNEIKKLTIDIDHLHACIRLFDPAAVDG
jgi:hypothetical protein